MTRLAYTLLYLLNLGYNMIKSSVDATVSAITGDIDPHVVEVHTVLKKEWSHFILANSITLTPGTLTVDIDHEKMF